MASGSVIQHNISALNSSNYLVKNNNSLSRNLEKLSSGYRINRAGDDAAGLAISEKMRSQIAGLDRANLNTNDGVSLIQTAEGALTEVHSMLTRLVELGTESANGVYKANDRDKIQDEVDQILEEIDRISEATNFNGIQLLDGTLGLNTKAFDVQKLPGMQSNGIAISNFAKADAAGLYQNFVSSTKASAQQNAAFTVDFGTYNLQNLQTISTAGGSTVQMTVTIAGTKFTVNVSSNYTTEQIAGAVAKAINASITENQKTDSKVLGMTFAGIKAANGKNYEFTAVASGTKIVFEMAAGQIITGTGSKGKSGYVYGDFAVGGQVSISATVDGAKVTGDGKIQGSLQNTVAGLESRNGGAASIDLKLTNTIVHDGAALKIDDKTFVFKVGLTSSIGIQSKDQILIDLTRVDSKIMLSVAASKISEALGADGTASFQVGVSGTKDGAQPILHITQKETDTIEFREQKEFTDLIKAFNTAPKGDGVSINIDARELKAGDTIRIDGQTYEFQGKGQEAQTSGAKVVNIEGLTRSGGLDFTANPKVAKALAAAIGGSSTTIYDSASTVEMRNIDETGVTGGGLRLQIGDTDDAFNKVTVALDNMSAKGLGLDGLKVTDQGLSADSLTKINKAVEIVSRNRGRMGALQNRLEHTQNNLSTTTENMTAAESSIRDVDMASEMMKYTKNQVLVQAAQSMLAQANQQPQQVLQLLR